MTMRRMIHIIIHVILVLFLVFPLTFVTADTITQKTTPIFPASFPPENLSITGPRHAGHNFSINFSAAAIDPDGDDVYCMWDWGDGNVSGWIGPAPSGEPIVNDHSWNRDGVYEVRVRAKDINNEETNWSMPYNVSIQQQITFTRFKPGMVFFRIFSFNDSFAYIYALETLGICIMLSTERLYLEATTSEHVKTVILTARNNVYGDNETIVDDNATDGFTARFQITMGLYTLTLEAYDTDGYFIDEAFIDFFLFFRIGQQ